MTSNTTSNIRVSNETKIKLDQIGKKNESYDDVIKRILAEYDPKRD